ncbi:MAG: proline--tRNA ligase [Dehalococcoidales bacterium]|nr:MAG: proline--tRNA ligase [Dehalococcoidales bacterium]
MSDLNQTYEEDFSQWYLDVVQKAELADYSPVRGCMVIRPYGYAIWENIQNTLDKSFKETGHQNAYFPLLIPSSFIEKEVEHLEGFSPQLATVTHAGGKKLEENLVIRPTSETIIGDTFSKWIQSYRDLPLLVNQWCNVVRWELRTRPFLRTSEFLWQEGHTAHASSSEAIEEAERMLSVYIKFAQDEAAIPVISGKKCESEKFPGAEVTYTIEGMMKDGKALQMGTCHNLGQNFAKSFDIQYLDDNNKLQWCWMTSWGISTRMIGAIIMVHGDEHGLVLPPRLAPIQVVIVPIYKSDDEKSMVMQYAANMMKSLGKSIRCHMDKRDQYAPGWKFNEWELRGVPVRIEIGPRDVANRKVTIARRDKPGKENKTAIPINDIKREIRHLLKTIQRNMFEKALKFRNSNTFEPTDWEAFKSAVERGFAMAYHCGSPECEVAIKDLKVTNRCVLQSLNKNEAHPRCIMCGKPGIEQAVFAKSY